MEQALGNVGKADESYAKGVASASVSVAVPATSYGLSLNVSVGANLDAKILIAYLAAKIGGTVPAEVASFLEAALAA